MATWKNISNSEDSHESSCSDSDNKSFNYSDENHILLNFEVTDEILRDISEYIHGYWKDVGRRLSLRECRIEEIDEDYKKEGETEKAYQMLLAWKRWLGKSATMPELQNVLIKIGRKDIAEDIAEDISSLMKEKQPTGKNKMQSKLDHMQKQLKSMQDKLEQTIGHHEEILNDLLKCTFRGLGHLGVKLPHGNAERKSPLQTEVLATKSSVRTKSEIEGHVKLQKMALQTLNRSLKFYQKKVNKIHWMIGKDLQEEEARQLQESLRELNDLQIQSQLDDLQKQVKQLKSMQDKSKRYAETTELDEKLGDVAKKLFKIEQTIGQTIDDLHVHIKHTSSGILCHLGMKLPRGNTSNEKKSPSQTEECDDDVFGSPDQGGLSGIAAELKAESIKQSSVDKHVRFSGLSKGDQDHYRDRISQSQKNSEEMHVRRKLNVSAQSTDEQFQLEKHVLSVLQRKHHETKPFKFSHSCMSQYLQKEVETPSTATCYQSQCVWV